MVNFCLKSAPFAFIYAIFTSVDLDPYSEYGSGSTKLLNTDPIWIRIQNTGFNYKICNLYSTRLQVFPPGRRHAGVGVGLRGPGGGAARLPGGRLGRGGRAAGLAHAASPATSAARLKAGAAVARHRRRRRIITIDRRLAVHILPAAAAGQAVVQPARRRRRCRHVSSIVSGGGSGCAASALQGVGRPRQAGRLGRRVVADNVLNLVCVGVEEGKAGGAEPDPLPVLGPEAVHEGDHLPLHFDHLLKAVLHVSNVLTVDEFKTRFSWKMMHTKFIANGTINKINK